MTDRQRVLEVFLERIQQQLNVI
jgi:hypothetical protein